MGPGASPLSPQVTLPTPPPTIPTLTQARPPSPHPRPTPPRLNERAWWNNQDIEFSVVERFYFFTSCLLCFKNPSSTIELSLSVLFSTAVQIQLWVLLYHWSLSLIHCPSFSWIPPSNSFVPFGWCISWVRSFSEVAQEGTPHSPFPPKGKRTLVLPTDAAAYRSKINPRERQR